MKGVRFIEQDRSLIKGNRNIQSVFFQGPYHLQATCTLPRPSVFFWGLRTQVHEIVVTIAAARVLGAEGVCTCGIISFNMGLGSLWIRHRVWTVHALFVRESGFQGRSDNREAVSGLEYQRRTQCVPPPEQCQPGGMFVFSGIRGINKPAVVNVNKGLERGRVHRRTLGTYPWGAPSWEPAAAKGLYISQHSKYLLTVSYHLPLTLTVRWPLAFAKEPGRRCYIALVRRSFLRGSLRTQYTKEE